MFNNFFTLYLVIQVLHVLFFWKGYLKAGRQWWEILIPVYSSWVLIAIIKKPWWWLVLLYIPVVGNIIMLAIVYDWLYLFGFRKKRYTLYTILSLGIFLAYVNITTKYIGNEPREGDKPLPSWINAILFAVVLATIIHTYFLQPFIIPTPSLEKTLLVGDFLFVSKFHYGARLPLTPLSMPMVHDTIPVLKVKSYVNKPQLPYLRIPGLKSIKRNDIVVFNWPLDTVQVFFDVSKIHVNKPIDKKSNYVKRCVALPGDTLEIKNGNVYINNEVNILPERARPQYSYLVKTREGVVLNSNYLYKLYGITEGFKRLGKNLYNVYAIPDDVVTLMENNPKILEVVKNNYPKGVYDNTVFPHHPELAWNIDNYGPIVIPKKGATVKLNLINLPLYKRIIETYEKNTLEVRGVNIYINNLIADSYTFKKDYYWMMGDNRHRSEDSRIWGFVPNDHVVGTPVLIWMSLDWFDGIKVRWERLLTTVSGEGKPTSYFIYVLILLGGYFIYDFIRKKRKPKSEA